MLCRNKGIRATFAVLPAVALTFACKDATAPPDQPATCQVNSVSVAPTQASMEVGSTVTLSATVSQQNCSNLQIAWSVDDVAIAQVADGVVTGISAGTATVTATVQTFSASATVQVSSRSPASLTWQFSRYVAVGQGTPPFGGEVLAMTGTSANDVYAGGPTGRIHRFDGTSWSIFFDFHGEISGMWAVGPGDLFVVGSGIAARVTGNGVATQSFSSRTNAVWAAGPTRAFAVGDAGLIIRYDGISWTQMPAVTSANLKGIFGFAENDIYAVGSGGTILHYDGAQWTAMASGTSADLFAAWGPSPSSVFVTGLGVVRRYDGNAWSGLTMGAGTNVLFRAIWGTGPNDVHAVAPGAVTARYDGNSVQVTQANTVARLYAMWGVGNDLFAGGDNTTLKYQNGQWQKLSFVPDLNAVYAFSANDAIAVGQEGTIIRYDGSSWTQLNVATNALLYAITAAGPSEIYVAGATYPSANALVLRSDGQSWQSLPLPTGLSPSLYAVWTAGPGHLAVGASSGLVLRYAAGNWSTENSGSTENLRGVWGSAADNIHAVGDNGTIVRFNGTAWSPQSSGTTSRLRAVWGNSADDIWAVGDNGTAVHFNGVAWAGATPIGSGPLTGTWGTAASDIWVTAALGAIHHFDGTTWSLIRPDDFSAQLAAVHGAAGHVFVVGPGGTIGIGH